jgi:hypothetical protein
MESSPADHESVEVVVEGLLLSAIGDFRFKGKKAVTVSDWITKVRDTIRGLLPEYYFIICKYPRPFTKYDFKDVILDWRYEVHNRNFKVLIFSEGVIKDYMETGDITEFCCGGSRKIERLEKDNITQSQPSLSDHNIYELKFEKKEFNKAELMNGLYKKFEEQIPDLRNNPKKYRSVSETTPKGNEEAEKSEAKDKKKIDILQEKDKKEADILQEKDKKEA